LHPWLPFETTRAVLADDVTFTGPLGLTHGADKYVEGVRGFSHQIAKAEVSLAFGEGENVCLIYDLVTKHGTRLPTAAHYRVVDGKVAARRYGEGAGSEGGASGCFFGATMNDTPITPGRSTAAGFGWSPS